MDFEELLSRVALAFGIGLLIGLERGWHTRDAAPGKRAAGVRTFAVSGLETSSLPPRTTARKLAKRIAYTWTRVWRPPYGSPECVQPRLN
jgi:hypothetical protein